MAHVAVAAAMSTSVVAVAAPVAVDAAAVSSAKAAVEKAEKLAKSLNQQINYDVRKKLFPKDPVGLPNTKLYNDTQAAYKKAVAAVQKAKAKEKTVLQTRLSSNVKPVLDRTAHYIAGVKFGKNLVAESQKLEANVRAYKLDSKTYAQYTKLVADSKKLQAYISKVYGTSTKKALTSAYLNPVNARAYLSKFAYEFQGYTTGMSAALKQEDYVKANAYKFSLDKLIAANNQKKLIAINSVLYKGLMSKYTPLAAEMSKFGKIYIASSSSASKPTIYGGTASKPLVLNGEVTIFAGKNKYINLVNVQVNGNITIKGDKTGAGTVTLLGVKVNKTGTAKGQIIVDDVADHSLHMQDVSAAEVVVNDANGSNIVAQKGVKVASLVVSEKAGVKGKVTLESKELGAIEKITVAAKGSQASEGVELKGDLSNTVVTVTGENAVIDIAKGAKVKELDIKAPATVHVEKGAVVD